MPHRDLHFDFNFSLQSSVNGGGVKESEIAALEKLTSQIHHGLHAMKEVGQLPFLNLGQFQEQASQISNQISPLKTRFKTIVVCGIGGSALGPKAIFSALSENYFFFGMNAANDCRLILCDTLDPDLLTSLKKNLDLKTTLFHFISKSGETTETLAQLKVFYPALKATLGENAKQHLILTTDPKSGALRKLAEDEGLQSFEIPPGLGGRYSVLSAVGLVPALFAGVNLTEFLAGAVRMLERCQTANLWANPAYLLGAIQYLMYQKQKNIVVLLPYSDRLVAFAEWYAQLWAESIGKKFSLKGKLVQTGSTTMVASGPQDQHSQLQLFTEGPDDKFILFFEIENFKNALELKSPDGLNFANYLDQHSIADILNTELLATEMALRESERPSSKISLPHLDAYTLGQMFLLFELATVFAGSLFDVNPFNQPGVENCKEIMSALLGKPGYEIHHQRFLQNGRHKKFVI